MRGPRVPEAKRFPVRAVLRPLGGVVQQAEALGARRFITIEEPATAEFRVLVRSMNALTRRVRRMLERPFGSVRWRADSPDLYQGPVGYIVP